eukprot:GEMP01008048.1.p1 GENE.GEMP01008048.1~~GEMP01008048.1.p1  ORF type:complete len:121 (+),score=40.07 GEMP01008048.1:44-406(+)
MSVCASFNASSGVNWEEEIRKYRRGAELRGEIEECEDFLLRANIIGSFEPLLTQQHAAATAAIIITRRRPDLGYHDPNAVNSATPSPARSQGPANCNNQATTLFTLNGAAANNNNNNAVS